MQEYIISEFGKDPNPLRLIYEGWKGGMTTDEVESYIFSHTESSSEYVDIIAEVGNPVIKEGIIIPSWWPTIPEQFIDHFNNVLSLIISDSKEGWNFDIKTLQEITLATYLEDYFFCKTHFSDFIDDILFEVDSIIDSQVFDEIEGEFVSIAKQIRKEFNSFEILNQLISDYPKLYIRALDACLEYLDPFKIVQMEIEFRMKKHTELFIDEGWGLGEDIFGNLKSTKVWRNYWLLDLIERYSNTGRTSNN